MRLLAAMFCMAALVADAAPNFVTQSMMKRRGLTDEQYELLWSMGAHPRIEVAAARDWIFRASRYQNVKEWLEDLGRTNDFAKLAARVPGLTETNAMLVATNRILAVDAKTWHERADAYWDGWTNSYVNATNYYTKYSVATNSLADALAKYSSASNRAAVAEARAEIAEALAASKIRLIQDEIDRLNGEKADLEEKIASTAYIALRPWLRLKLAAVEAAIRKLEGEAEQASSGGN